MSTLPDLDIIHPVEDDRLPLTSTTATATPTSRASSPRSPRPPPLSSPPASSRLWRRAVGCARRRAQRERRQPPGRARRHERSWHVMTCCLECVSDQGERRADTVRGWPSRISARRPSQWSCPAPVRCWPWERITRRRGKRPACPAAAGTWRNRSRSHASNDAAARRLFARWPNRWDAAIPALGAVVAPIASPIGQCARRSAGMALGSRFPSHHRRDPPALPVEVQLVGIDPFRRELVGRGELLLLGSC